MKLASSENDRSPEETLPVVTALYAEQRAHGPFIWQSDICADDVMCEAQESVSCPRGQSVIIFN